MNRFSSKGIFKVAPFLALCAGMAVVLGGEVGAQSIAGHNANAPVDYAADRIELQERQDRVVLTGSVDIKQSDLRLRAARTIVNFTNADQLRLQRITASGGVVVTRGSERATGDVAIYDLNQHIITMVGNATLQRAGGDTLRGGRFVIDLDSGVSSASGGQDGRVSGTFSVPKGN
jgi:lipopolysaccharide export system protein LptA